MGLSDATTRYRMAHRKSMPKFGSAKNPFCGKKTTEPAQSPVVASEQTEASQPLASSVEPAARTENQSETSRADHAEARTKPGKSGSPFAKDRGSRAARPGLVDRWIAKADSWLSKVGTRPAKPAIPRFSKSPVQGELRLDQIKVVRNDLSDSDVDIVAARPKAVVPTAPVLPDDRRPAQSGRSWGRMATRLFGAGKT